MGAPKIRSTVPGIYLITCLATGKVYVGQAINITARWGVHRHHLRRGTHNNGELLADWKRYGPKSFTFEVVSNLSGIQDTDLVAALNVEECRVFALHPLTYNILHPDILGVLTLSGTRSKLSVSKKAAWARLKTENPDKVAEFSEKIRASKTTPEALQSFSEFSKALWADPEHRATQSKKNKARWNDQQFADNNVANVTASWADPAARAKRMVGLNAAWSDPERKAARLAKSAATRARRKAAFTADQVSLLPSDPAR